MSKNLIGKFFNKIKLAVYKNMYARSEKKGDALSSSEYFCVQCIHLLDKPTVSQFADFLNISASNATYKLKKLIKKGYITKKRSQWDKREFVLVPTDKFENFINSKEEESIVDEIKQGLSQKDQNKIDRIIKILNE